jgi:hypothetical protein
VRGIRFKVIKNDLERACHYPETLWERNLIRQIAATSVCIEEIQRDIVAGKRIDLDAFVRLNGNLLRQYQLLGLQFGMTISPVRRPMTFEEAIGGFNEPPRSK